MKRVFSSHVEAVDYKDGELYVIFRNKDGTQSHSVYENVPEDIGNLVYNAPSIGTALHQLVKGKFSHRYAGRTDSDGNPIKGRDVPSDGGKD